MRKISRALGYAVAVFVIGAAVLLTLARLALPYLEGYREPLQAWATRQLGQPVTIGRVDARLFGLVPTVVLDDVVLRDRAGQGTIARFREARIGFRLLASLRQGRLLLSGLTVIGGDFAVERDPAGALRLRGLTLLGEQSRTGSSELLRWLLEQERIVIEDTRLSWRDPGWGAEPLDFQATDLTLSNQGDRHRLTGTVLLPPSIGHSIRLGAEIRGRLGGTGEWSTTAYVAGQGLSPAGLSGLPTLAGVALKAGEADVNIWSEWIGLRLRRAEGELSVRQARLQSAAGVFDLSRIATIFQWGAQEEGWRLDLDEFYVERPGHAWERARIRVEAERDRQRLLASFADLGDVASLVGITDAIDAEQQRALQALRLAGVLRDLRVELGNDALSVQARFQDVASEPWRELPGLAGADGRVRLGPDGAVVQLASRKLRLTFPNLFREPLRFEAAQGRFALYRHTDGGWRLTGRDLQAANEDIAVWGRLRARGGSGLPPFLDLTAQFKNGRAVSVSRYLPVGIMKPPTVAWLDAAFEQGQILDGGVVVHGPLSRFPFLEHDGQFKVQFRARGVRLAYQPGWPALEDVEGEVVFAGRGMTVAAERARLFDTRLEEVKVAIEDLTQPLLSAQGRARGPAGDVLRFLAESPLANHFPVTKELNGEGEATTRVELTVPISHFSEKAVRVVGDIALEQGRLTVADSVRFEAIQGQLSFTEASLAGRGLKARLFGGPVSVDLSTPVVDGVRQLRMEGQGTAQAKALSKAATLPLLERLKGSIGWRASYTLPQQAAQGTQLEVVADLDETDVDLPHPLRKGRGEALQAKLSVRLGGARHGEAELAYGEEFAAVFSPEGDARWRAAVRLGKGRPILPDEPGLQLTGFVEALDAGAWGALLAQGAGMAMKSARIPPIRVDMERLHLIGLEGDTARGQRAAGDASWWRGLPPLQVDVARFGYGDMEFGRLVFDTHWQSNGPLRIENLSLFGPQMRLSAEGDWRPGPGRPRARLDVTLSSPDLGRMLTSLGYATVIQGGRAQAQGTLSWPGTPTDFAFDRLEGQIHVRLDQGVIEEVDPGAGRLLGLLSLSALPSRLLLDFSDVFGKGFEFSRIEGDLRFEDGNGYSDNLRASATTAEIFISGRTGFRDRDYDQLVTVVPNVSGTLPVAGGLYWGPQVGAVLLLLQKLFLFKIDEAAQSQYHVTGTWEKPLIKRMKKRSVGEESS